MIREEKRGEKKTEERRNQKITRVSGGKRLRKGESRETRPE